ncbi:MAG: TlpA disulfide reductase family protein [Phycisphaerales bacterium]
MKMVIVLVLVGAGLLGLVVYAQMQGEDTTEETSGAVVTATRGSAPAAKPVMHASGFKLEDYRGEVVVMDFWATWCGPCKMAMPGVQKLHEKFQGRPVRVFGMSCWERGGDPASYMKQNGFTYSLVTNTDQIAQGYGVRGIPHFVVIGVKGETLMSVSGYSKANEEKLAQTVEQHLKDNNL